MALRTEILDALIETSARPDAFRRLHVRPSKAAEVARNTWLRRGPNPSRTSTRGHCTRALLSSAWLREREQDVIVVSACGRLRLADRIPTCCAHCSRASSAWIGWIGRGGQSSVLCWPTPAGWTASSSTFDRRSTRQIGTPTGLDDRTMALRIDQEHHRIGDVVAKRVRARPRITYSSPTRPHGADADADVLADRADASRRLRGEASPGC